MKYILSISLCLCLCIFGGSFKRHYVAPADVISVHEDIIEIETVTGHIYAFYGYGFEVGQRIHILLDNSNTPIPEDDKVIDVI